MRRNHRVRRTVECTRVLAGHANSQTTKLYDRRGQKVLLEDMERIRYRCLSFKRHVQEASRCERESSERSLLSSIYRELTKTAVLTLLTGLSASLQANGLEESNVRGFKLYGLLKEEI